MNPDPLRDERTNDCCGGGCCCCCWNESETRRMQLDSAASSAPNALICAMVQDRKKFNVQCKLGCRRCRCRSLFLFFCSCATFETVRVVHSVKEYCQSVNGEEVPQSVKNCDCNVQRSKRKLQMGQQNGKEKPIRIMVKLHDS